MQDIHIFRNQDLVLKVDPTYDPTKLRLREWEGFLDKLCWDRDYQKEAIKQAIIYMVWGKYKKIEELAEENYKNNPELQIKYSSLDDYLHKLQIQGKLFANIDLATWTGKSYVMYGIAQMMLGLWIVDRVLLLCPSLTIEAGLKEKFEWLSWNQQLKDALPESAVIKNPRIIDANQTIKGGDICIENIHAVYEKTGSSIQDSLKWTGANVLVLNDESHHIFNKTSDKDVKKWKEFLTSDDFGFQYIVWFTGTAYKDNDYFNDVIYRFSLREAIENRFVKSIEYVSKDDTLGKWEKFQKIHQNHIDNIDRYPKIKPLTILVTADIEKAEELKDELVEFLMQKENKTKEQIEEKVLIITSHKDHKSNLLKLKTVDSRENKSEWIISVSMLSEGWDVKNVFQIVPWEDRAFNSKLLISQVLGRGLRLPPEYEMPQPKVVVFNHDAWSRNIIELVNEVLEIEKRVVSEVLTSWDRCKYNFEVYNLDYSKEEVEVELETKENVMNFSRIFNEWIKLEAQVEEIEKWTVFETLWWTQSQREKNYLIEYATTSVDDIVDKIYSEFEMRDWEWKVLQLNQEQYTQNNLPPRGVIKEIIVKSMKKLWIKGERLIEKNKNHILAGFGTLLRKKNKTVITKLKVNDPILIKTIEVDKESLGIWNFRKDCTVFLTTNYLKEVNEEQGAILSELSEDESLPRSAIKEQNEYLFKNPLNVVLTKWEPERKFIEGLCKQDVVEKISCWIKSRDRGFYGIEYSLRYGDKWSNTRRYTNKKFNPDFFIQIQKEDIKYTLVIETKMDWDDSEENKAKYKYALEHFNRLNEELEQRGIKEKYIFHFLSPQWYSTFFEYLKDWRILEGQDKYRCALENSLENNEEEL